MNYINFIKHNKSIMFIGGDMIFTHILIYPKFDTYNQCTILKSCFVKDLDEDLKYYTFKYSNEKLIEAIELCFHNNILKKNIWKYKYTNKCINNEKMYKTEYEKFMDNNETKIYLNNEEYKYSHNYIYKMLGTDLFIEQINENNIKIYEYYDDIIRFKINNEKEKYQFDNLNLINGKYKSDENKHYREFLFIEYSDLKIISTFNTYCNISIKYNNDNMIIKYNSIRDKQKYIIKKDLLLF